MKFLGIALISATMAVASASEATAVTYTSTVLETVDFGGNGGSSGRDVFTAAQDGTFLSIGIGGTAIFSFGSSFISPGAVIEITNVGRAGYVETADIYGWFGPAIDFSSFDFDLSTWDFLDSIDNLLATATFTFTGGPFLYLAVRDTTPDQSKDGFDIDAVGVTVVPLPASVALLGSGVLALGALGWRKRRQSGAVAG